jgi:opacity protein-like surface antigen
MKMKKTISTAIAVCLLGTTGAFAATTTVTPAQTATTKAKKGLKQVKAPVYKNTYIKVGASSWGTNAPGTSAVQYTAGFGYQAHLPKSNFFLGAESDISYANQGDQSFDNGMVVTQSSYTTLGLSAKAGYTFFNKLDVYGDVGIGYISGTTTYKNYNLFSISSDPEVLSISSHSTGFSYGGGIDYRFAQHWGIGVEYKQHKWKDFISGNTHSGNGTSTSIGGSIKFYW